MSKTLIKYLIEGRYLQDSLNPDLWDGDELKARVEEALFRIADEFIDYLEMPDLEVVDIILTGSMANYNWTEHSDIDLHIVVPEMTKEECGLGIDPDEYFRAKKSLWNDMHEITIYGHPVELYVQMVTEPHYASGVYSVQNNSWLKEPEKKEIKIDDHAVQVKAKEIEGRISDMIESEVDDEKDIDALKERIKNLRKSGLAKAGEFSVENLAFKQLRNSGDIEKLWTYAREVKDKSLSLEGALKEAGEVYGYWITPDNGLVQVPYQEHLEWYVQHVSKYHRYQDSWVTYKHAYKNGYIRVMLNGEGGFSNRIMTVGAVEGREDRLQDAIGQIMGFFNRRDVDIIHVTLDKKDGSELASDEFIWPRDRRSMMKFIKGDPNYDE